MGSKAEGSKGNEGVGERLPKQTGDQDETLLDDRVAMTDGGTATIGLHVNTESPICNALL